MLSWSVVFLVVAIIAAVLGFGGIAGTATGIAKVLFAVFVAMFALAFVASRRPRPEAHSFASTSAYMLFTSRAKRSTE